jgi:hypothetical protein
MRFGAVWTIRKAFTHCRIASYKKTTNKHE